MAGYTVPIASETKAFKQGIESGVIKPVEDANRALEELGQNRGPEELERDMRDAQKATEKLADETKDTARTIEREYRDSFRKVKNDADDAFDGAKRGAGEFKDEARQTARESAASFREPADALDALQETAANAFSGFGPAGAAAGIAAAVGIGVVGEALTAQQEAADELKRRMSEAYRAAAEEGRTFLDEAQINAAALDILQEQGTAGRKRAQEEAHTAGVDFLTVIRAQAGDQEALNLILDQTREKEQEVLDARSTSNGMGEQRITENDIQLQQLQQIIGKYEEQLGIQEENKQVASDMVAFQEESNSKQAAGNAAAKKAIDERGAALQAYADKAASIPNPVLVPQLDTRDLDAGLEEIRRRRISLGIDVVVNERRGRTLLE